MLLVDLIIDGNYILLKNAFTLHKHNLLFGGLQKSLEISVSNYRKWFPFANVYFVSDSREKSWRTKLNKDYKSQRKKDIDIDWSFVFDTYSEFKDNLKYKKIKVLEAKNIEGDDFTSYLVKNSNDSGRSTVIVSNDYDIKQLVKYNLNPLYINVMTNEMMTKQKIFLPKNFQLFLNAVSKLENDDIFNINDNQEFLQLLRSFIQKYETVEINGVESLIVKVISGDISDNIKSVWSMVKNGKKRGIGEKGAMSVVEKYHLEFGEINLSDPDLYENIADLICEKKKLSKTTIISIKDNIEKNMRLINLDINNFPKEVINRIENEFTKI
jgi:5'-3' exonuclease